MFDFYKEHLKNEFNSIEWDIATGSNYEENVNKLLNYIPSPVDYIKALAQGRISLDRYYLLFPETIVIKFMKYGIESMHVIHNLPDWAVTAIRKNHAEYWQSGIAEFGSTYDIQQNLISVLANYILKHSNSETDIAKEVKNIVYHKMRITEYSNYDVHYNPRMRWFQ